MKARLLQTLQRLLQWFVVALLTLQRWLVAASPLLLMGKRF